MSASGTAPLLNAIYTSSKEGERILKQLTKAAGFSTDNIISRLAIARSLAESGGRWDSALEADATGKQIKGSTLLGRQEIASALLAMIVVSEGQALSTDDLRRRIRLHWERGLRLMNSEAKDSDVESLLISYAERALLSEQTSKAGGAVSPRTALGQMVVGQARLREQLAALLDEATENDPPRVSKPVLMVGSDGVGKRLVARAIATGLQLPFVDLLADHFNSPNAAIGAAEEQLALQGYARRALPNRRYEYPACVIYVGNADQLEAGQRKMVLQLHPRVQFVHMGQNSIRVAGGGLVMGATAALKMGGASLTLSFAPYTRDEIADVLRREVGAWPLEIRRFLALAGRLNPERATLAANDFLSTARARGERPSEGLLLDIMTKQWGMDRLGLTINDYRILDGLEAEESIERLGEQDLSFLERLGLVQLRKEKLVLTQRGREACRARRVRMVRDGD